MKRVKWSFKQFAKVIVNRQIKKDADTFIIIYGLPRSGKTTLGFNILIPYLKLMRKMYKKGKVEWNPENHWSKIFKKYFASDSRDMLKKVKNNPPGSFVFIDEGIDVVSWMELMSREQRDLLELIQKTGKRHMLTILITPSLGLLTKFILARAHYLFIIPTEPGKKGNTAFLLKNYTIPFLAEEQPFGIKKILADLKRYPHIASKPSTFYNYLYDRQRLVAVVKFRKINEKIYSLYDKMVKEPSIMRTKEKKRMVPYAKYFKTKYALDTILYNLYMRDGKTVAQITRLLTDKFGTNLLSRDSVQRYINQISALEKQPSLSDDEIVSIKKRIEITEDEDVLVDSTEEVHSSLESEEQTNGSEDQADARKDNVGGSSDNFSRSVDLEGNGHCVDNGNCENDGSDEVPADGFTPLSEVDRGKSNTHDKKIHKGLCQR